MNYACMPMALGLVTSLMFVESNGPTAKPSFERKEDVIYGRKYGTALTME
jgi:hypothetical protein